MKSKSVVFEILLIFISTFIVSSLVTFLYSLFVHSEGKIDWSTAFVLSLTLSIIFPLVRIRENNSKNKQI